jgi:GntR family transcriptional regulator
MYRRIAQELQQQIRSGIPEPGGQLPTELELAERYDASRNTVRDAIKWLAANGLVETRQGQGTFVLNPITPFVTTLSADPETGLGYEKTDASFALAREKGCQPSESPPKVAVLLATGNVAARLRIPEGTQVVSRRQERYIDGAPWSLQTTFYPMDLVVLGAHQLISAETISGGTVSYLRDTLGLTQIGYRDRILVRPPDDDESRFFGLSDDARTPVVTILRTGYRNSNEGPLPYRVTFTVLRADRNQFVINSGEVPAHPAAPGPRAVCQLSHSSSPEDLG